MVAVAQLQMLLNFESKHLQTTDYRAFQRRPISFSTQFKQGTETHYGWIRCDVLDEGRTLIIKDYAYETIPNNGILAGDTVTYLDVSNLDNSLSANVYSFEKGIYIQMKDFKNTEIIVSDLTGREIIKKELKSESEIIDMSNYPIGLYSVTLIQGDKRLDKKVFIE